MPLLYWAPIPSERPFLAPMAFDLAASSIGTDPAVDKVYGKPSSPATFATGNSPSG